MAVKPTIDTVNLGSTTGGGATGGNNNQNNKNGGKPGLPPVTGTGSTGGGTTGNKPVTLEGNGSPTPAPTPAVGNGSPTQTPTPVVKPNSPVEKITIDGSTAGSATVPEIVLPQVEETATVNKPIAPGAVEVPFAEVTTPQVQPSNVNTPGATDATTNAGTLPDNGVVYQPGYNKGTVVTPDGRDIVNGPAPVPFDEVTVLPEADAPSNVKTPGATDATTDAGALPDIVLPEALDRNPNVLDPDKVAFDEVTVRPDTERPSNVKTPVTTDPIESSKLPDVLPTLDEDSKNPPSNNPDQGGVPDVLPSVEESEADAETPQAGLPAETLKEETPADETTATETVPEVVVPQATWTPIQAQTVTAPQMPNVPTADIDAMRSQLEQWQAAVNAQNANQIDYATNQSVTELQRAEQDAQAQFKEQAESVALDERQGMDNSALYAEARGDKGGIGQAQYNQIQAAAAQNRLAVQQQQTKLSTDTARQIADLRAQGEFEKADAVLETAQTYLTQLTQLEQWAANYGLDAAQFEASLAQWQAEFNMAMAEYQTNTDMWNSEMSYQAGRDQVADYQWGQTFKENQRQFDVGLAEDQRQFDESAELEREQTAASNQLKEQNQLASMGEALLDAGVMPSDAQLSAMGITKEQAQEWVLAAQLSAAQQTAQSQFGTSGATDVNSLYQKLKDAGVTTAEGALAQLTAWGVTSPGNYSDAFLKWYSDNKNGDTTGDRQDLPNNGGYITDTINLPSQPGGKRVYEYMKGWWDTGDMDPAFMIEQIEGALANGNMTEEEAEILMDYMGM